VRVLKRETRPHTNDPVILMKMKPPTGFEPVLPVPKNWCADRYTRDREASAWSVDDLGFEPRFFSLQGRGSTIKLVARVQAGLPRLCSRSIVTVG
jgi:hypothetical protein